jgi:chromosome segregation ATPase
MKAVKYVFSDTLVAKSMQNATKMQYEVRLGNVSLG